MKNIDVTQIVDPSIQQPFTGPSLKFLQDASLETFKAVGRNMVKSRGLTYSSGTPYLIDKFHAYEAMIFYNGEFFLTSSSPITGYAHLDTTPDAYADPLLFTDGVSRNVHNDRYLYFDATATGALFNASAIVDITGQANIINGAFTAITVNANWTVPNPYAGTGNANAFEYRKTKDNTFEIRGIAKNSDTGVSATIFTLPVGYRPVNEKQFLIWSDYVNTPIFAHIKSNGDVIVNVTGIANNSSVSFDNVRFSLD